MSTIRPLATIAILAVVGVFLAQQINKSPASLDGDADWRDEAADANRAPAFDSSPIAGADPTAGADPSTVTGAPPAPPVIQSPLVVAPASPSDEPPTSYGSVPPLPALAPPSGSPAAADPLADLPLPVDIPDADYAGAPPLNAPGGPPPVAALPPSPSPSVPPIAAPPVAAGGGPAAFGSVPPLEASAPIDTNTATLPPAPPVAPFATTPAPPTSAALASPPPAITPTLPAAPATPPGGYAAARPGILAALAGGQLSQALLVLSMWRDAESLTATEAAEVESLLAQLAGTVIYSDQHLLEGPHTVRPGETLETIAQRYSVPWQLLGKINGVANPSLVQPGQTLKVVRGPFRAVVDLSDGELFLTLDGRYAGRFPVSLDGAAAAEGQWRIAQKQQTTGKQLMLAGAAGSAFGQQVVLTDAQSANPAGVGGKIAVAQSDLDDLFDILSVGSDVTVRR